MNTRQHSNGQEGNTRPRVSSRRAPGALSRLTLLLTGAAAAAALFPTADVQAQTPPAPKLSVSTSRAHADIFAGNGKPGPYTLTWNNVRATSLHRDELPVVLVDGQRLKPEQYALDAAKGLITFANPVKTASVVRVSYTYDAKVSKRNTGPASAPLTVPLMRLAGASVKVTAVPGGGEAGGDGKAGASVPLVWGLGGKTNLLGGGLTSSFHYAGNDSIGMQLGYGLGNARNGLDLGYSKADKQFATRFGKNFGMAEATRRRTLGARLTPANWLGATFNSTESHDLTGKGEKEQNALGLRLGGVGAGPTLAFSRVEDISLTAARDETSVTTDKLDLNARLAKTLTLTASGVRADTDAPKDAADTTTEDVAVSFTATGTTPGTQATLSVNVGGKEAAASEEDRQGVTLRVQPAPQVVLAAEQKDHTVTPVGADGKEGEPRTTSAQTASAEITPMPGAKLTTALSSTETDSVKVSATNFGATLGFGRPMSGGKTLEIVTGVTNRSTEVSGQKALDTTQARFALRPHTNLTLTGGLVWNPEHQGAVSQAQRQEVGLTARIGALELGSGYSLTTVNGTTQADDRDPQFGQVSLTLGLQFNRSTRLNGSYQDSLNYRAAQSLPAALVPRYLKTVGLGITHTPGGDLSFMFGGTITENRAQPKPTDIKAEAKLGYRF